MKREVTIFTVFLMLSLLLLFCSAASATATRGLSVVVKTGQGTEKTLKLYRGSYALLIGASSYHAGWPILESVPAEMQQLAIALEAKGFSVTTVTDPDSKSLQRAFEDFIDQYGYQRDNRLLFFFSGHGHTRRYGNKGYLVPVDAPDPNVDERNFIRKALPMSQILAWARDIEARHALFMFDSCFSGTVFKQKALPKPPEYISELASKPVRQFISAGTAGQTVPAKSTFTPAFIDAITYNLGDLNKDGYVTGMELGLYLQQVVPTHIRQTPQYGKIADYDLARGDFIFVAGAVTGIGSSPGKPTEPEKRGRLTVFASPANAQVRLLNSRSKYKPGLELPDGRYQVEVSQEGYETQKRWLEIKAGQDQQLTVTLVRRVATVPLPKPKPQYHIPAKLKEALDHYMGTSGRVDQYKARVLFMRVGKTDDPLARMWMARLHHRGLIGFEKDQQKSQSIAREVIGTIKELSDMGNSDAMFLLASGYNLGLGVAQDKEQALDWFRKAADTGCLPAMTNLGMFYLRSNSGKQDDQKALFWFQEAERKGVAQAMLGIGWMYEKGRGVSQDDESALNWYRRAVEKNYPPAMNNLGLMYARGQGVARNDKTAVSWYRKGAEQDYPEAISNLARMYEVGRGVAQNYRIAVEWYQKAAEKGHAMAMNNLGVLYEKGQGVAQDYKMAAQWYQKAADKNHTIGMTNLGSLYEKGKGVSRDYEMAINWYQKAADKNNGRAMYKLGRMYANGQSVPTDHEVAAYWYQEAADRGYKTAEETLSKYYFKNSRGKWQRKQ